MKCAVRGGQEWGPDMKEGVREGFLGERMTRLSPEPEKGSLLNRGREQLVAEEEASSDQLGHSGMGDGTGDWTGGRTTSCGWA